MQNSVLKLTALTGVVGIGFLVVYQAQKGMSRPGNGIDPNEVFSAMAGDGLPDDATETELGDATPFHSDSADAGDSSSTPDTASLELPYGGEPTQPADPSESGIDFRESAEEPAISGTQGNQGELPAHNVGSLPEEDAAAHITATEPEPSPFNPIFTVEPDPPTTDEETTPTSRDEDVTPAGFESTTNEPEILDPTPELKQSPRQPGSNGPQIFDPASLSGEDESPNESPEPFSLDTRDEARPILGDAEQENFATEPNNPSAEIEEPNLLEGNSFDEPGETTTDPTSEDSAFETQTEPADDNFSPLSDDPSLAAPELTIPLSEPAADDTDESQGDQPVDGEPAGNETNTELNTDPNTESNFVEDAPGQLKSGQAAPPKTEDDHSQAQPLDRQTPDPILPSVSETSPFESKSTETKPPAVPVAQNRDEQLPRITPGSPKSGYAHTPATKPQIKPRQRKRIDFPGAKRAEPRRDTRNDPQPNILSPETGAAPLNSDPAAPYQGDGTVQNSDPRGPQQPRLKLEKTAPPRAIIGQPLIYSIIVQNDGESPAREVIIEDRIPRGTQLSGTIPRAELIEKRLTWKLGTLEPGARKKISIRVIPVAEGPIGSVATVKFAAEVAAQTVITSEKIEVKMSAPREANIGQAVSFRFKLTNAGNADADKVMIRNILPDSLSHAAGKELEYDVGTLPAGTTKEVELFLKANELGEVTNRAVVTTAAGVSIRAEAKLKIVGPKLTVARTGPKRRYVGRAATFVNTITNTSQQPMFGTTVYENVPSGMEFAEASNGGQYNPAERTIAWRVDQLDPGESKKLHVKLIPRETGRQESSVHAIDRNGQRVIAKSETAISGFATVSLDVPETPGPVEVGETFSIRLVARNRGTAQATNAVLKMMIPAEMEMVSVTGPVKYERQGNIVRFAPLGSIQTKSPAIFDVKLLAKQSGDARLKVQIEADQLSKPLNHEEAILILSSGE